MSHDEPVTCEFWEGPMHGQTRTIRTSELINGLLEVIEEPFGQITEMPKPPVIHVYRWPGNSSLLYQGVKR